ncbi:hypothetical protein F4825DRAFT_468065 [Nemania diffusa]|nr:hypothetical protein F4825DRAFT_468065 [Nemania diffusa]
MSRLRGRYSEVQDQSLDTHEGRYEEEGFGYHSQYHLAVSPRDFRHDHENKTALKSYERQYKPTAVRYPFLLTLLLALLTTLAFLIYAVVSLPVIRSRDASEQVGVRGLSAIFPVHISTTEYEAQGAEVATHNIEVSENSSSSTRTSTFVGTTSDTSGHISTETGTETLPYTTLSPASSPLQPESNFGKIGTQTVTEALPNTTISMTATADGSKPQSDFGKIGTKTITEAFPEFITITTPAETTDATTSENEINKIGSTTSNDQPTSSMMQIETVTVVTIGVTTITGIDGSPSTTSTKTPTLIPSLQTSLLMNSEGRVTETQIATVTVTPSTSVQTDSSGKPIATVVIYPTAPTLHTEVYVISAGHYFMGTFLPTLVASILAIAVQILDMNVKTFQPWHALTHEQGALGRDSLCLETGGWRSLAMGLRSLAGGHAVVFLSGFLSLASSVLIPVSAGAITLDLRGDGCKIGGSSASNCAYVLSVSPTVARAAIGILAVMSLATILLVLMVGRWRLGVYTNPWSMCTLASLSANPDVRRLVLDAAAGANELKYQDLKLDYYSSARGQMEYGIVVLDRLGSTGLAYTPESENAPLTSMHHNNEGQRRKQGNPFFMLGIIGRLCSLFILGGVLVFVLYYALTSGDTAFERFIDSDSFGVQFLFSSLGVIISLLWSSFYSAVAVMIPYQMLSERPREASQSILLAPPTNAFSGLWHAARTRRVFLGVVSLASILSQSLGLFLSNVPYQVVQTFLVYQLSTWASVGIISSMFLVLLASFFVKWPDMPVEPGTIAGAMYYVCNTSAVDMFEGLSTLSKKERDRAVANMALLYELSETVSATGDSRVGLCILQTKVIYPGW